jgi:membrane protease YdiL (CAAX protease family)
MRRPDDRYRTDVAAGIAVLSYSAVLNEILPEAVHVPANLAAAATLLTLAWRAGASPDDVGLAPDTMRAGARVGLMIAAPIVAGIGLAARTPVTAPYFDDARVLGTSRRRAVYETAIRIPVGTALGEELMFRGALLGLFGRRYSTASAVGISSLLFGLWHVLPTLHSVSDNPPEGAEASPHTLGVVAGTVAATAVAGVAFATLRLRSRSVLTPVIVHAAINSAAFIAARQAPRRLATQRSSLGHCAAQSADEMQ